MVLIDVRAFEKKNQLKIGKPERDDIEEANFKTYKDGTIRTWINIETDKVGLYDEYDDIKGKEIQRANITNRRLLSEIALLDIDSNKMIYEIFSEDKNGEFWSDFHFHLN